MSLLQMSFAGAVMITAVIIIRALAVNRLPKKTFLILWGIVLMRLLVPFSIPSELSVYSLAQRNVPATLPGRSCQSRLHSQSAVKIMVSTCIRTQTV